MKFMKHSICRVPDFERPLSAASNAGGEILRNVSLLSKTQTVLINVAPDIPPETTQWLSRLRYAPEKMTEIPQSMDEFHVHYWLTINNCVDENDRLVPEGAPVGVVGVRGVSIFRGYIKNVIIAE